MDFTKGRHISFGRRHLSPAFKGHSLTKKSYSPRMNLFSPTLKHVSLGEKQFSVRKNVYQEKKVVSPKMEFSSLIMQPTTLKKSNVSIS